MSKVAALSLAAILLAGAALAATRDRGALWQVVRACVANHNLTGAAFPCLEVNLDEGEARGFVVLRPPLGRPDTILSPTTNIVGVEDPALQAPRARNYFEDAWNARRWLPHRADDAAPRDNVALAVNSAFSRTQDQLHIHIGCIARDAKKTLAGVADELRDGQSIRLRKPIHGLAFWGFRFAGETPRDVNPFVLAGQGPPGRFGDMADLMIVVARARLPSGSDGFVVLAARNDPSGPSHQYAAEDFLNSYCLP